MSSGAERQPDKKLLNPEAWRYLADCYSGRFRILIFYGVVAAAQSLLVLPVLYLIRHAFDVAIPEGDAWNLVYAGIGIFAIRLANSGIALWLRAAHIRLIKEAVQRLREDILSKLYTFSRAHYTRLDRTTTHAQIVQDTERLDNMSNQVVSKLLPAVFAATALLVVLAFLNWFLLVLMVSLAPVLFLTIRLTGRFVKRRVFIFQRAFESFSKGMLFVLQHMDLTRILSCEEQEIARRTAELDHLRRTSEKMAFIYAVHGQIQSTVVGLCGLIILVVGGGAVASGSMTLGEFLSFWVAAGLLNGRVNTITNSVPLLISGNESIVTLHRLGKIGETRPYHGTQRIPFTGLIDLEGVQFGYDRTPILKGVDLKIRPESNIAILGDNGAGKSTILLLLLGFYRPQAGQLLADGIPFDKLDIVELRRHIGVVMQHPTFFPGTIAENISYGYAEAPPEEIRRAAQIALADEFIEKLPDGYDTPVGEEGVLLSGGEVQRIAIARALLRNLKLLVLDEPTNHLEISAINRLMKNLLDLDERPALVTISHDPDVFAHADELYNLENGILRRREREPAGSKLMGGATKV